MNRSEAVHRHPAGSALPEHARRAGQARAVVGLTTLGIVTRLFGGAAALAVGTWYTVGLIAGAYPALSGAVLGAALIIPGGWAIADLTARAQEDPHS